MRFSETDLFWTHCYHVKKVEIAQVEWIRKKLPVTKTLINRNSSLFFIFMIAAARFVVEGFVKPIWFYCRIEQHSAYGSVFVVIAKPLNIILLTLNFTWFFFYFRAAKKNFNFCVTSDAMENSGVWFDRKNLKFFSIRQYAIWFHSKNADISEEEYCMSTLNFHFKFCEYFQKQLYMSFQWCDN